MANRWQFSLRYLMAEMALIGAAISLTCVRPPIPVQSDLAVIPLMLLAAVTWCAAIGGAFGRMKAGAIVGCCLWGLWLAFAIAVGW